MEKQGQRKDGEEIRNVLTPKEKKELEKDLARIIQDHKRAAEAGCLSGSEQDGYHDEGFQLGKRTTDVLFAQIQQLRLVINNARVVVPKEQRNHVAIGNKVTIRYENNGTEAHFVISGYIGGSSSLRNRLSINSPLGKALIGKKKGDIIDVELPSGKKRIQIVEIFLPSQVKNEGV